MGVVWKYTPPKVDAALRLVAAVPVATNAGAEHLLGKADELAPEDTGALRASGKVTQDGTKATVSFSALSDDGYDYAVIQHESLNFHHERGEAKYLERPMHTEAEAIGAVMAQSLREAINL